MDETHRSRRWPLVVIVLLVVLLAATVVRALHVVSWPPNPFAERTVDRSQPVLLQSIRGLSRYEASVGTFQVIIDLQHEAKFLSPVIKGDRTLFVAAGTVDAYVDFDRVGKDAIRVDRSGHAATVRLPHAALERANLDEKASHVVAEQRGLLDRIGAFLGDDPDRQHELYALAQRKIGAAASHSVLRTQAERNTRAMLTGMLRSLGYTSVTVSFGS
ncbi:DUF4230 domain-containing protein [Actinocatenispora comari]|jgi:hypothetical protein|uniref:DUF4230 domain-containing protein n=1 Tax=Actinocatenispora comari TaxID=2807577 RepID=A0A8J4AFL1_9ACTN|nr:DUF4230 domain-containing protein [Actinocatenispora comari]GIL29745.1 hypothetical protein NUM_49990 [Actinocatenispora comari]